MSGQETTDWKLIYTRWDPDQEPLREALCTLGNGNFATRGAAEESRAGGCHYPGTYLAGGYNRLQSEIAGRMIENEDLVNWPNWLVLKFRIGEGEWLDLDRVELLEYRQELDVKRGVLERRMRVRDYDGHVSTLEARRIVHMAQPHLAAIQWSLTPENWSGRMEIHSALDGTVKNDGVARYRQLNGQHLQPIATGQVEEDGIYLVVETNQSHLRMAQAARTQVFSGDKRVDHERQTVEHSGYVAQEIRCECERGVALRVEKILALYVSGDHAMSEPLLAAKTALERAAGFRDLLAAHTRQWSHLWDRCDMDLAAGSRPQFILRLHIFHLLQTTSMNTIDLDVGVPARGWHGEAYRGHIFWDELFIFPFLKLRIPELTRSLLMYRYRRVSEGGHAAAASGYRGAMYPWQSGSDGREETQVLHLNPKSGRWVPDNTYRQRHVNAAIARNVWQYYQATDDAEFLSFHGAEMIVEIARFWASFAVYNPDRDRYELHDVVGPDEFHTKYPDREELGLKNNAYTNVLAVWTMRCAAEAMDRLPEDRRKELIEDLEIADEEIQRCHEVSRRMFLPFHGEGIISQFEGYDQLLEFDWERYRSKYGDIQRLDRILEAEGDDVNRYKAGKQADVLMLFYLFSADELRQLFEHMGYPFEPDLIPHNIEYYLHRTTHGSTLSRIVHSWVLARSDREHSWGLFQQALESDIADIQGGTTSEGIHLGAMAGTVDLIQRGHTGIEMRGDVLWFNPCLPDVLRQLRLQIRYHGHRLGLEIHHDTITISFGKSGLRPVKIGFGGTVYTGQPGETLQLKLDECG